MDDQPSLPGPAWIDTHTPEEGQIVKVQARDGFGPYTLPFRVEFRDDGWWNAETGEELDCFIAGWLSWEEGGPAGPDL